MWNLLPTIWKECFELAWAAYCADSVPIGSVITNEKDQIVAYGRNGGDEISNKKMSHAELNALVGLDSASYKDFHHYCLYTTFEPCPMCFGSLYMSGIRNLVFACADSYAGSTNIYGSTAFMSRKNINIQNYENNQFIHVNMAINVEYEKRHRSVKKADAIFSNWRINNESSVLFGLRLYAEKSLTDMLTQEAGFVYDWLLNSTVIR